MNKCFERIRNGVIKENPIFVMMLGMCATLAVTRSAINGLGMGASTMVVLILSNLVISLLRRLIPDSVRLPAYIVVVASMVTIVQLLIEAYIPVLYSELGVFIPLIVVNCIILGRAEAYASKHGPLLSLFDGVGMGLGFTVSLIVIGMVRELFGAGSVFGVQIMPGFYKPLAIITNSPGAFLVMAIIALILNGANIASKVNEKVEGCDGCCAHCAKREAHEKEAAK